MGKAPLAMAFGSHLRLVLGRSLNTKGPSPGVPDLLFSGPSMRPLSHLQPRAGQSSQSAGGPHSADTSGGGGLPSCAQEEPEGVGAVGWVRWGHAWHPYSPRGLCPEGPHMSPRLFSKHLDDLWSPFVSRPSRNWVMAAVLLFQWGRFPQAPPSCPSQLPTPCGPGGQNLRSIGRSQEGRGPPAACLTRSPMLGPCPMSFVQHLCTITKGRPTSHLLTLRDANTLSLLTQASGTRAAPSVMQ